MSSWVGSLTLAKSAYVLIICLIIVVLARELYGVLWNDTLYVGSFQYFKDGRSSEEHSKAFPAYVLGQHQLLRSALIEENRRRELGDKSLTGVKYHRSLPSDLPEAARWSSILSDAELKIQGFDIGKVLTTLRAWVAPPAEINGFVEKSGETARAAINYPSRKLADGRRTPASPFETGVLNGDASVALAVAASIVWTQAAEADAGFGKIPREVFVSWILIWWDYRLLRSRTDTNQSWTPEEKNRWKQARALVDNLAAGTNGVYAESWRLRADLIETIPADLKSDTDLRTSDQIAGDANLVVEDRRRYAEAEGVATAITALNQISQAALKTAAPLPDSKIAAVAETVKSVLADPKSLYPGRPVWVRLASAKSTTDLFSITATAIVRDGETQKLLLPDYVMSGAVDDAEYEFRLSPSEPPIARAKRTDLLFPDGQQSGGVLLAPLAPNTAAKNVAAFFKGEVITLKPAIAELPPDGSELQLVTSRGADKIKLKGRTGLFANVDRITGPGDGGAPVVDSNQALVAMAYSGSGTESQFLSLKWLLDRKPGLQLIP
jgi:hypothetical protein